jgi:hypothetical protein
VHKACVPRSTYRLHLVPMVKHPQSVPRCWRCKHCRENSISYWSCISVAVRCTAGITTIWRNGRPDADGQQAAAVLMTSAVQDQGLGWPSARDKRNTAKVARDTSTSPLSVNRFAALDTSDSGLGPQAIAPQVPERTESLPLSHRRPTPTATLYHSCRPPPRYSKRWDVERARSECRSTFTNLCGREFTSKDITVCAIQETWLDPQ